MKKGSVKMKNLRDLVDMDIITEWRKDNINTNEPFCSSYLLLDEWESAKQDLYTLFGNQLSYSFGCSYNKSIYELEQEFIDLVYEHPFTNNFREITYDNITDVPYYILSNLVNPYFLARGTCLGLIPQYLPHVTITKPDGHEYKFFRTSKVMRVLGTLAKSFDIDGYEDFRLAASRITNQKNIKGTVELSIHPMSFMSMSNSTTGWSSCMRWSYDEPGEFCLGTTEMLNSRCVLVAQMYDSTNQKKWRELFIADRTLGIITPIKGYPYESTPLEEAIVSKLVELASVNWGMQFMPKPANYEISFYTKRMYNDLRFRKPQEYLMVTAETPESCDFNYSGKTQCMVCGETNVSFDFDGTVACADCDPLVTCAECGERFYPEDMLYIDGEPYCEYCYGTHTCNLHEDRHENLYSVVIKFETFYLCEECLDEFIKPEAQFENRSLDKEDLTEAGLKYFGFI